MKIIFKSDELNSSANKMVLYKTNVSYGKICMLSFKRDNVNDEFCVYTAYASSMFYRQNKKLSKTLQVSVIYDTRNKYIEFIFGKEIFCISYLLFYTDNMITFTNIGKSQITMFISHCNDVVNYSSIDGIDLNKLVNSINNKLEKWIYT